MENNALLSSAAAEIRLLRAANQRLSIKVETFDRCYQMAGGQIDNTGGGMFPDVVQQIDKAIAASEQSDQADTGKIN